MFEDVNGSPLSKHDVSLGRNRSCLRHSCIDNLLALQREECLA